MFQIRSEDNTNLSLLLSFGKFGDLKKGRGRSSRGYSRWRRGTRTDFRRHIKRVWNRIRSMLSSAGIVSLHDSSIEFWVKHVQNTFGTVLENRTASMTLLLQRRGTSV